MTHHLPTTSKAHRILQRHAKLTRGPDTEGFFRFMGNGMAVGCLIFSCINGCVAGVSGKADSATIALGLIGVTFTILGWRMSAWVVRSIWLWRLNKMMRRMRNSGEIVAVDDSLMQLWERQQDAAGIEDRKRVSLERFPDTLRSVAEKWNHLHIRPDGASPVLTAQMKESIKQEMKETLTSVVAQQKFEHESARQLEKMKAQIAQNEAEIKAEADRITWDTQASHLLNLPPS